jgi:hypothetical protein
MKHDALKQYVSLRDSLQKEKAQLEGRLAAINEALGFDTVGATLVGAPIPKPAKPGKRGKARAKNTAGKKKGNLGDNSLSLRSAVAQVTSAKPLDKKEILEAVDNLGYKFTTKNPLNSLNQILYKSTNPKFKNVKGKFGPV